MASTQPRPKRAGEDFTRTHHAQDDDTSPDSKKPRFDLRNPSALAPDTLDEDQFLDADEIGKRGQKVRRKAVNIDGYDSDSENEGFSARIEKKSEQKRRQHDAEDDDMFAELQDDFGEEELDADEAMRKNKKNVRFLRDDEIEGQDVTSKGGKAMHADLSKGPDEIDVDEDEQSESDVAEEERAKIDEEIDEELGAGAKKKNAPLLDAFNMRTEQEEGRFDDQGNYVRKAVDPDAVYDTWLDGLSKKDIRKAKEAAEKREEERKEQDRINDNILTADALTTIITHLERGETILEALARLGKGLQRKPKWQNKKKKTKNVASEDAEMTEANPDEELRRTAIDAVTGAADILMGRGQPEIYDTGRELLTRQYRNETGDDWVEPPVTSKDGPSEANATMWEFRWADARDGGNPHGPYDTATMESWKDAGYFGEGVEFRRVGDTQQWSQSPNFV
ncbi:Glycine-tyrosine-phenylalanine (GYF) domain-containing protein [Penicillium ucsense]|uniref:Glycine-tyrosine-phenylalanine (GYF) domain-containing protein n=1 Tax=Penicillium ucsense TaxID=2839758 RepID=A0A8J8W781_9EURO|nr:Glycine-tyrosine-phenylalanine (GYF) domain-containing protein [Penicillium ucsense]KAF7738456.1 Glycine-tyrosine-phenylalanine (GYF) domain-containing protein [Penicillium ucsense]